MTLEQIWSVLIWPLSKILFSISIGLLVANLIEALNWTRGMAKLASPLIRLGHMKDVAGASFSLAFFSGLASNTMLSEAYDQGRLKKSELVLSNLFNSLPTYLLHLPTMFFVTVPFLGQAAFIYVGLTLFAAFLRTLGILLVSRFFMPDQEEGCLVCELPERGPTLREAAQKTWKRFKRRIGKMIFYTAPVYVGIYLLNRYGFFAYLEEAVSRHIGYLSFISPKAASIVVFNLAAEFTAGLAAAGALLNTGSLPLRDVVLALLLGNVLSTPMRAFRHQLPYYAGIFKPGMAFNLILYNQLLRAGSLILVGLLYYILT